MILSRSSLVSIVCVVFMLAGMRQRNCLAKECTNIPGTVSHTVRSMSLINNVTNSIRSRLPSQNQDWRASLTERHVSLSRRFAMSILPDGFAKNRKDWLHENVAFSNREKTSRRGDVSHLPSTRSERSHLLGTFPRTRAARSNSSHHMIASNSYDSTSEGFKNSKLRYEGYLSLKEVSLHRVSLAADTMYGVAQETNLQYLLMLDVESLVYSFRLTAGVSVSGSPYGGWENTGSELRGHFVGHYLSAAAKMWASTHSLALHEKMVTLVDALGECQDQMGTGYLSAFPSEQFDRFEAIQPVWAPYYTIHKIMAGLLDQYNFAGNERALGMLLWMAKYFLKRVEAVIKRFTIERHWNSLNEEVGGINDVMYRVFMLTGDLEHLKLAHLFDKPCFLGLLALQTDGLSGFHSNTHIPLVVGAQMRYEATGDRLFADLSQYFLEIINTSHRYATGGTSAGEFWQLPNRNADILGSENQETCTTYNMLKVARNLFKWTKDLNYADYYERLLVNGILGIQRGKEPGVMIYMLPQAPGSSKAVSYHGWGTPYNAFWCCYGTGVESFSKLGDSIYFEDHNPDTLALLVAQFVSSNLTWDAVGLVLSQKVVPLSSIDPNLLAVFEFYDLLHGETGDPAKLSLRIPKWTTGPSLVRLNGAPKGTPHPGKYFNLTRIWRAGDVLQVELGISLSLEKIQDDREQFSSLHAIFFGPYLLAGMTHGKHEIEAVDTSKPSSWIVPVPSSYSARLYTFSQHLFVEGALGSLNASNTCQLQGHNFVLSSWSTSAGMKLAPQLGTTEAAESTFLLNSKSPGDFNDSLIGKLVSFELYSSPGQQLVHTGVNKVLAVVDIESRVRRSCRESNNRNIDSQPEAQSTDSEPCDGYETFKVQPGLSGADNTISFQAAAMHGCFLASDIHGTITLQCQHPLGQNNDPDFSMKASFTVNKGMATYNPVSFFAKGKNRQYLLFPLNAYLDERYAVYFNLTSE